jgi:MraZ protein
MKGTDGCLFVLSESEYQKVVEKINTIPLFSKAQSAARQFLSSGIEVEEDNQGRFLLKTHLREFASIVKNVVFVGVGNRVEIWAEEKWNAKFNVSADNYDEIVSELAELGI